MNENKNIDDKKVINVIGSVGDFLGGVGDLISPILGLFGSKYVAPVVAVSTIAKKIATIDDEDEDVLKKRVLGLSAIIDIMEHKVNDSLSVGTVDVKTVNVWLDELRAINKIRQLSNDILD